MIGFIGYVKGVILRIVGVMEEKRNDYLRKIVLVLV